MEKLNRKVVPISIDKFKEGTATSKKTGKPFKWVIWNIDGVVITPDGKEVKQRFSTFDDLSSNIGNPVEVSVWEEEYTKKDGTTGKSWKLELPKRDMGAEIRDLQERVKKLEDKKAVFNPEIQNEPKADEEYPVEDELPF